MGQMVPPDKKPTYSLATSLLELPYLAVLHICAMLLILQLVAVQPS